jgi:hypothetical protein
MRLAVTVYSMELRMIAIQAIRVSDTQAESDMQTTAKIFFPARIVESPSMLRGSVLPDLSTSFPALCNDLMR